MRNGKLNEAFEKREVEKDFERKEF